MSAVEQQINPAVVAEVEQLAQSFATANPFKHVVIDQFFQADFCRALLDEFPSFSEKAAINEDGEVGHKAVQERVSRLGKHYKLLNKLAKSSDFRELVGKITGIADLQYDPYYFGGGTHDNRHGQDLDAHVDFNFHPITKQHRRLNLIVYLNERWEEEWGGCLDLHRDPYQPPAMDEIKSVLPLMNRCVIFETTEWSWHGFQRIQLPQERSDVSRKSFALYYYTDTRPVDETAKPHSTIYVERHLPERFRDSYCLTEQDQEELTGLLARRDQHLKRLYQNIADLSWRLNQIQAGIGTGELARAKTAEYANASANELRQVMQALQAEVLMLRNSSSWRMTAPLRRLRYELGRIKRRLVG